MESLFQTQHQMSAQYCLIEPVCAWVKTTGKSCTHNNGMLSTILDATFSISISLGDDASKVFEIGISVYLLIVLYIES